MKEDDELAGLPASLIQRDAYEDGRADQARETSGLPEFEVGQVVGDLLPGRRRHDWCSVHGDIGPMESIDAHARRAHGSSSAAIREAKEVLRRAVPEQARDTGLIDGSAPLRLAKPEWFPEQARDTGGLRCVDCGDIPETAECRKCAGAVVASQGAAHEERGLDAQVAYWRDLYMTCLETTTRLATPEAAPDEWRHPNLGTAELRQAWSPDKTPRPATPTEEPE